MGYGYPIDNIKRLENAVHVWKKAQKRFKHFVREVSMTNTIPKYH